MAAFCNCEIENNKDFVVNHCCIMYKSYLTLFSIAAIEMFLKKLITSLVMGCHGFNTDKYPQNSLTTQGNH